MSRRIIVCLACVALLGVTLLSLHALGPVLSVAEGQVGGGGDGPAVPISPQAGMPRPWEAGLQASPFSVVNLFNGNLITIIPLVAFDPVGPPVELTLYHNSASADLPEQSPSPWGFSLGAGWSISYGGSVVGDPNDTEVTLIEDDGSEYLFTLEQGVWEPEAGVHDRLEWDDPNDQWVLTRPNQSKRIFDHEYDAQAEVHLGRLIEVHDSSGNYVEVARDSEENNFRILRIESAAENNGSVDSHRVTFEYDDNDRLDYIQDPIGRNWTFHYYIDAPHPLEWVKYPSGGTVDPTYTVFQYDARDRIQYLTNRDEVTWDYAYDGYGKLASVTDPAAAEGQPRYAQQFSFSTGKSGVPALWRTTYTPRRGEDYEWQFGFDDDGNFRECKDPLDYVRQYAYDSDHNCTSFIDELSHTWSATYGPVGNVETVTSPINQTWRVTWEQPYPTERPNFYRVTQVTDPLNHWVQYGYGDPNDPNDPNDPTLVTAFTEQADGQGNPNAVTTLEYWHDENDACARGQLRLVTDANGVQYLYEYDQWGYSKKLTEGLIPGGGCAGTVYPVVIGPTTNNPAGWPTHTDHELSGCYSSIEYDANGNPTGAVCWLCQCGPPKGVWPRRLGDPPSPHWDFLPQFLNSAQYDNSGRPTELELQTLRWTDNGAYPSERDYLLEYDNLGRPKNFTFRTNEHSGNEALNVGRRFDYYDPNDPNVPWYDPDGRVFRFKGPDGQHTEYRWLDNAQEKLGYDKLGRPEKIVRAESGMSVEYTYDAASRVTRVDYGNGTKIIRQYDNANRLEHIYHYGPALVLLYQIDYVWNLDNTLDTRIEYDGTSQQTATVEFEYDTRHRLTGETRTLGTEPPQMVYNIQYDYDQLGNRTVKIENTADRITYYEYDTDYDDPNDPNYPLYPTRNNRLLKYEVFEDEVRTRTVWYVYYDTGHVSNIIVKDEGEGNEYDWYRGLCFTYWGLGHSQVGLALWEKWPAEHGPFPGYPPPEGYEKLALREFRYHPNPRGRFMARDLDPNDQAWKWSTVGAEHWTDYDIPMPNGDFDVTFDPNDAPVATEQMRYLEGFGLPAQQTVSTSATQYLHGDLIRSTNLLTDGNGGAAATTAYTAFGEFVTGYSELATRYQYAGGWGYESGLLVLDGAPGTAPILLEHVGFRWYDPSIGRFIQRDPIGLRGGLNVYEYAQSGPTASVDPLGLELKCNIVVHRGRVYVHWRVETPHWLFRWLRRSHYKNTQVFPLDPAGHDGNATSDDCEDLSQEMKLQYVTCVSTAIEKLDEETRKAAKRWIKKAGKGGKIFKPVLD